MGVVYMMLVCILAELPTWMEGGDILISCPLCLNYHLLIANTYHSNPLLRFPPPPIIKQPKLIGSLRRLTRVRNYSMKYTKRYTRPLNKIKRKSMKPNSRRRLRSYNDYVIKSNHGYQVPRLKIRINYWNTDD